MKKLWIMLLAVAVALVIALPAAAGKPDKPGKPDPSLFDVTMSFTMSFEGTNNGFATTSDCTGAVSITMELSRSGTLTAIDVPILEVSFPGVEWYRHYPYRPDVPIPVDFNPNEYPLSESDRLEGTGLTDCHGAGIDVYVTEEEGNKELYSIEQYPGLLMLTVRDGTVDLIWHTDYYREWMPRKNGRWGSSGIEDFSYVAIDTLTWTNADGPVDWNSTTGGSGVVTGDVGVTHFSPGSHVPFEGSPVDVEFTLAIVPQS